MPSLYQIRGFRDLIMPETALEHCIDWIQENLEPDEVFSEEELAKWALDNGYTKPD